MSIHALDYHTTGTDCWRLDTGASNKIPALLGTLRELGFAAPQLRWILPTPVHLDHAGRAGRHSCVWRSFLFPRLRQYHTCA